MKRTNIVIDETLIERGKRLTGLHSSKAVVDFALKELVRRSNQRKLLDLFGAIEWDGHLRQMRNLRFAK
jgi:Arc/MetJ family transcription regulator